MGKPMNEKQQNLQDTFLNAVRKSKTSVTIFLVNGVKLQGNITWFDNICVLLRRDGQAQLVYKHAISTVMPLGPIQLLDELAHLSYQRSRLVRSWTHLERQRGGFGFLGGPGESQIETDRRLINDRMAKLKNQLEQVTRT